MIKLPHGYYEKKRAMLKFKAARRGKDEGRSETPAGRLFKDSRNLDYVQMRGDGDNREKANKDFEYIDPAEIVRKR